MGCGSSHIMPNTNYDVIVLPIYRRNMKEPSCLHFVYILDKYKSNFRRTYDWNLSY